jgi:hypothetical protein
MTNLPKSHTNVVAVVAGVVGGVLALFLVLGAVGTCFYCRHIRQQPKGGSTKISGWTQVLNSFFVPVIEIQIISDGIHDHSATLAALQTLLLMFEVFINLKKKSQRHFKFWFFFLMP